MSQHFSWTSSQPQAITSHSCQACTVQQSAGHNYNVMLHLCLCRSIGLDTESEAGLRLRVQGGGFRGTCSSQLISAGVGPQVLTLPLLHHAHESSVASGQALGLRVQLPLQAHLHRLLQFSSPPITFITPPSSCRACGLIGVQQGMECRPYMAAWSRSMTVWLE